MESRKCTGNVTGPKTPQQFADDLVTYVKSCPQPSGYCYRRNPDQPMSNSLSCGGPGSNIGWQYTFSFEDDEVMNLKIRWGTDFGVGFVIIVDDVLYQATNPHDHPGVDFWWANNWNSIGVFYMDQDFPPGEHTVYTVGLEDCCDGPIRIQMNKNNQGWIDLDEDTGSCALEDICTNVDCSDPAWQNYPNCINCVPKCLICEGTSSNCTRCSSDTRDIGTNCECLPQYYDDGNIECEDCHPCAVCTGVNQCTECVDGYYLSGTSCLPCDVACATCQGQADSCLTCSDLTTRDTTDQNCPCLDTHYQDGNNVVCAECVGECVTCTGQNVCQTCTDGHYVDSSDECSECNFACGTCFGNAADCQSCADDDTRDTNDLHCGCLDTHYQVGTNAACTPCVAPCVTCTGVNVCQTCEDGFYVDENDECSPCDHPCETCAGQSNVCTLCADLATRDTNDQECNCIATHYQVGTEAACTPCVGPCTECTDVLICQDCVTHHYVADDQSCQECNHACAECNGQATTCTQCADDSTRDTNQQECPCLDTHYQHGTESSCRQCVQPCVTCDAVDNCFTCEDGHYLSNGACLPCNAPCDNCSHASVCITCLDPLYDADRNCQECLPEYYKDGDGNCQLCSVQHGIKCGTCSEDRCITCAIGPTYYLPECVERPCVGGEYKEGLECLNCLPSCLTCPDGLTCDSCRDGDFLSGTDCIPCSDDCATCTTKFECTQCAKDNFALPECTSCEDGYLILNGECTDEPGPGYYPDPDEGEWKECEDSCENCDGPENNECTSCELPLVLNGPERTCGTCDDISGMTQAEGQPLGTCVEKCGDGVRLSGSTVEECDDGNTIDGDGCSSTCQIEENYGCSSVVTNGIDQCYSTQPIGFRVVSNFRDQYLNLHENAELQMNIYFNRTFTTTQDLVDLLQLRVKDKECNFRVRLVENLSRRELSTGSGNGPSYTVYATPDETLKGREIEVDFEPKSAFENDGTYLAETQEESTSVEVTEYYYYSEKERGDNDSFQLFSTIALVFLMISLSIYIFRYKNYFNRFYNLFFVIDIIQLLYFYRFINVRWPINGVFFFRNMKPMVTFYLKNFHEQEINDANYGQNSTGLDKFDKEEEVSLFQNNAGSLLTLIYLLIFVYGVSFVMTIRILYSNPETNKVYRFFHELRFGYLEWGIIFDVLISTSGVFVTYIFLSYTNVNDVFNMVMSNWIFAVISVFFVYSFVFTLRNKKKLYSYYTEEENQKDEQKRNMNLAQKIKENPTFKFRNIWHFIDGLEEKPMKSMLYYIFFARKVLVAGTLISLQTSPISQVAVICALHIAIIIILSVYKFFEQKREFAKVISGEIFVMLGVATMFFLCNDASEDEPKRMFICWIILGIWLTALIAQFILFIYQEIVVNLMTFLNMRDNKPYKEKGFRFTRAYDDTTRKQFKTDTMISPTDAGSSDGFNARLRAMKENNLALEQQSNEDLSPDFDDKSQSSDQYLKPKGFKRRQYNVEGGGSHVGTPNYAQSQRESNRNLQSSMGGSESEILQFTRTSFAPSSQPDSTMYNSPRRRKQRGGNSRAGTSKFSNI